MIASLEFNLGDDEHDFRVPDGGLVAPEHVAGDGIWIPRAVLVVEVLPPGDETFAKLDFYATRVKELIVIDPDAGTVRSFASTSDASAMLESRSSPTLGLTTAQIAATLEAGGGHHPR